jgi:hypothetical protein
MRQVLIQRNGLQDILQHFPRCNDHEEEKISEEMVSHTINFAEGIPRGFFPSRIN